MIYAKIRRHQLFEQKNYSQNSQEVRLPGYDVAERTVSKYMVRPGRPRTQTWRTFLNNHAPDAVHIDILKACDSTIRTR